MPLKQRGGHGSVVVKVMEWLACYEYLEPCTSEQRGPMHVKCVEAQTSSCWCDVEALRWGCQLRCRPRCLTIVQNCEIRRQNPWIS
ncbi:hypothetical protein TNCV_356591 [Trichonephila clavipes]|nr:hypothetical protein TNCV_356591 [Trichonephila clavipes]